MGFRFISSKFYIFIINKHFFINFFFRFSSFGYCQLINLYIYIYIYIYNFYKKRNKHRVALSVALYPKNNIMLLIFNENGTTNKNKKIKNINEK